MNPDWMRLPDIVWYLICEYLTKPIDIIHLSCTNHFLHQLLEQNSFWRHLIRIHFGPKLLSRYCDEIFHNNNTLERLFASTNQQLEFQQQYMHLPPAILRNGWNLVVTGAQNGNRQGFIAAKRAKYYFPKLSPPLTMAINEDVFRAYFGQNSSNNRNKTLLSKLVFFYLFKPIRLSAALQTFICFSTVTNSISHPMNSPDCSSDYGVVAVLDSRWLAAFRGEFYSILPGRYAIVCRLKLCLLRCEQPSDEDQFTGEFICIPEFGLMSSFEWDQDWFDLNYVLHRTIDDDGVHSHWFEEQMGIITVYEMSTLYFGLRVWQIPYRKYTVMCDYIELKVIE